MKKLGITLFILSATLWGLVLSGCDGSLSASGDGDGVFSYIEDSSGAASRGELKITDIDAGLYGTFQVYVNSADSER
jgi:hypothetical protein